jgi:predicted O-methyltransferase YrrM
MVDIIKKAKNLELPQLMDAVIVYEREARFCQANPEDSHLTVIYKLRQSFPEKCDYLEIGSLFGFSMVNATRSSTPGKFVGIDLFETTGQVAMNNYSPDVELRGLSKEKTTRLVQTCNIHNHEVNFILGNSQSDDIFKKALEVSDEFDVMFIDGDHSYEGCLKDFKKYSPHLRIGGFLLFDDQDYPEVQKVILDILNNHSDEFEWIEWPQYAPKFSGFFRKIGEKQC